MDDDVCLEVGVVRANLSCDTDASLFAVDVVLMGAFFETNLGVAGVSVRFLEIVQVERRGVEDGQRGETGPAAILGVAT